ncbi:Uncharacterised protein [uncultured archaeon]|nr:Uncharacterised protein [uncultured archaeon]
MTDKKMGSMIKTYQELETENNETLNALSDLRTAFTRSDFKATMDQYYLVLKGIKKMGTPYGALSDTDYQKRLMSRLFEIESKTGDRLEKAMACLTFGNEFKFDLYDEIERINYSEENGVHNFGACGTLHDLVRCLHSSSLEELFDSEDGEVEEEYFGDNSVTALRYDNHKNQGLLEPILSFYKNPPRKAGTERYKIIMLDDKLIARVKMGCHFSYLDVNLSGTDSGSVKVRFYNTNEKRYSNAPSRAIYVQEVLARLGFEDITNQNDIVAGRISSMPQSELPEKINQVARMFASSKDLDLGDVKIKDRVPLAVEAFFNGTIHIKHYLNNSQGEDD